MFALNQHLGLGIGYEGGIARSADVRRVPWSELGYFGAQVGGGRFKGMSQ